MFLIRSMDELYTDLKDLSDGLNRLSLLPADYEGKDKVRKWLGVLSGMSASDELSESQARQMLFDLESSYGSFNKVLHHS